LDGLVSNRFASVKQKFAGEFSCLPCCFLAAILYLIQDSSKEAAGKALLSMMKKGWETEQLIGLDSIIGLMYM
jgi:hypothetical protein